MNTKEAEDYLSTYYISKEECAESSDNVMYPVKNLLTEFLDEQTATFEQCAKLMMSFLAKNKHPHCTVIITIPTAELLEGSQSIETDEFLKD